MSGSTNVENKNNAYIVFMDVEPKKEREKLKIEIGNHGEKEQDGDYEIKLSEGKVLTSDTKAKRRISKYTKSLDEMVEKYKGRAKLKKDDEMSK